MISDCDLDGIKHPDLLKKIMVSGRVPEYVKKYAEDNKIKISELIMAGFDRYREQDVVHAIERLSYHKNRVIHWEGVVLRNDNECNTKVSFCNTVRKEFKEQGRGHPSNRSMDRVWLQQRVKNAQKQGILLTVDELYDFCIKDKNNGGKK